MKPRWVTFDCFGTLVDWNTGFSNLLTPLFGSRTPEVVDAYHHFERELEAGRPHRLYRDVLSAALVRATAAVGVSISEGRARALPEGWGSLPVLQTRKTCLELCERWVAAWLCSRIVTTSYSLLQNALFVTRLI